MDDDDSTAARLETVEHAWLRIVGILELQGERLDAAHAKLDAILAAAVRPPGPSPVAEVLAQLLATQQESVRLLRELPAAIAAEMADDAEWDEEAKADG